MAQLKFSELPKIEDEQLTHVIVRTQAFGGYWGRGTDVAGAIKAATWIGSGDKVYVAQCDATAHCDEIEGSMHCNKRGPLYKGVVAANKKDVRNVEHYRD